MEFIDTDGLIDKGYSDEVTGMSPTQAYVAGAKFAEGYMRKEMLDLLSYVGISVDDSFLEKYVEQRDNTY